MFGFSFTELIVIGIVALLVLGPERIPGVARSLGRALQELRRSVDEVKTEFAMSDFKDPFNLKSRPQLPKSTGLRAEPLKIDEIPNCETVIDYDHQKAGEEKPVEISSIDEPERETKS